MDRTPISKEKTKMEKIKELEYIDLKTSIEASKEEIERCQKIDYILTREMNPYDDTCGRAIREMYDRIKSKAWMAVTSYWLKKRFPDKIVKLDGLLTIEDMVNDYFNKRQET